MIEIKNDDIVTIGNTLNLLSESKSHGALADASKALQEKMDDFNQLLKTPSIPKKVLNKHLQGIFKDAKALIKEAKKAAPTPTEFAGIPTEFTGIFEGVRTYGMVGLWSLTNAETRNIESTQEVQQSLMSLEQNVEELSLSWSNYYTAVLTKDEQAVQTAANKTYPGDTTGQQKASAINAATSTYNYDSTNMQTMSSNYSSQNNLLSNGVANAGQNLSTDGAEIQQVVTKIMDSLSKILSGQI